MMSRDWFLDGIAKAMDTNDDDTVKLLNQLQLIEDLQYGSNDDSRRDLLETIEKLYKCSQKASLTREVIIKIEKTIETLKSQCDRKSLSTNKTSKSSYRRTPDTHGVWDGPRDERNRDRSTKRKSKETTKYVRSWTKYNETLTAKAPCSNDTSSSDDTSKSSYSERNVRSKRDYRRPCKEMRNRRNTPDHRRKYGDGRASRSPFTHAPCINRSISRSPVRHRRVSTDGQRRYDAGGKQPNRRSRSRCRRASPERHRSNSSEKRGGKCYGRPPMANHPFRRKPAQFARQWGFNNQSNPRNRPRPTQAVDIVESEWSDDDNQNGQNAQQPSNPQAAANNSIRDALKNKIQSQIGGPGAESNAVQRPAVDSACGNKSNLYGWQGEFDLNAERGKSSVEDSVNRNDDKQRAQHSERWKSSAEDFVNRNDYKQRAQQNECNKLALDVQRTKIEFSFAKSMKDKKLNVNTAFDDAITDSAFTNARTSNRFITRDDERDDRTRDNAFKNARPRNPFATRDDDGARTNDDEFVNARPRNPVATSDDELDHRSSGNAFKNARPRNPFATRNVVGARTNDDAFEKARPRNPDATSDDELDDKTSYDASKNARPKNSFARREDDGAFVSARPRNPVATSDDELDDRTADNASKNARPRDPFATSDESGARTKNMTAVRSRLSTLITTTLDGRQYKENIPSNESPFESSPARLHSMDFDIPSEEQLENALTPPVSPASTFMDDDDSIDDEIIERIICKATRETNLASPYELARKVPFDIESIKRAIATAKELEAKSVAKTQQHRTDNNLPPTRVKLPSPPIKLPTRSIKLPTPSMKLPTPSIKLPTPSIKFLSPASFQPPATPRFTYRSPKRDRYSSPPKNFVERSKNQVTHRWSTTVAVEGKQQADYYPQSDWKTFRIPKKTINSFTSVTTTTVQESYFEVNEPSANERDNENSDMEWSPIQSPNTQCDDDTSVLETVPKSVHNPSRGEGSRTSSSVRGNNEVARGLIKHNAIKRRQKPQTIQSRPVATAIKKDAISRKQKPQTTLSRPAAATFKNVNPEWHSLRKVVKCQMCDKPHGNSLVSHFVNKHPQSEVSLSRLPPEVADYLRAQTATHECKVHRREIGTVQLNQYTFEQFCYFCNVSRTFPRSIWIAHIGRHTGYYRFKCNHCSRLFAIRPTKGRCHQANDWAEISQPQFNRRNAKIPAYVCNLCNYVRLHQHEIITHLIKEHDDDPTKFKKFIFLSFPSHKSKYQHGQKSDDGDFLPNLPDLENDEWIVDSDSESEGDWESDQSESGGDWASDESELEKDWVSTDEGENFV